MKDFMAKATAFLKSAWDKTKSVSLIVWAKIKVIAATVWAKIAEFFRHFFPMAQKAYSVGKEKTTKFVSSVTRDKSKLILAIILAIAILFSAIAVVKAVKGIVNGVTSIFASDKADEKEYDIAEAEHAEVKADDCEHCENGVCIHCDKGFIDCPNCDKGVCVKCEGTGENPSKMLGLLLDNCTECRGSGECNDCNEDFLIDCKYCEGGKCTECAEEETKGN